MKKYLLILFIITLILIACESSLNYVSENENLINKVNAVNNQWINYDGKIEHDNKMMQSQFIPYNVNEDYILNKDSYVSYYKGENFITTELQDAETELETVEEADGVILSFNKENKSGIKLVTID